MSGGYFRFEELAVGYDGKALIRDINIDIGRGDIVTLIGPNGAGKSTILKSITRQLELICGSVYIDRKQLWELSHRELASKVAVVLTERVRPELMTCYDIVASGRYPYTGRFGILTEDDKVKVYEAMKAVNADEIADCDFSAISDGQRQRIMLARAICQDPEVMILDEPTSFLDVKHKLELLDILRDMAKRKGITVVMSLHEIELAQKISDRIICVKGERLFRYGTPEDIFKEDMIRELYDMERGFFDPMLGSIELPGPQGKPQVFVISSCGTGIPVYRRLQRENVPFAAGILYTNDIDYSLARLLAAEVITEEPFQYISEEAYEKAVRVMKSCDKVINAGINTGPCNEKMRRLLEEARRLGKLREEDEHGI